MNVTDLIEEITARWPRFNKRWEPQYREQLQQHAGPNLEQAWRATLAGWRKDGAPKPADILARMPHNSTIWDRRHFEKIDEMVMTKSKRLATDARAVLNQAYPDYDEWAHQIDAAISRKANEVAFALWQKHAKVIEFDVTYTPQLVNDIEIETARKLAEYHKRKEGE